MFSGKTNKLAPPPGKLGHNQCHGTKGVCEISRSYSKQPREVVRFCEEKCTNCMCRVHFTVFFDLWFEY